MAKQNKTHSILIIEDELHVQRLIKLILEKGGVNVITASSGEEGLKLLKENARPDLIVLDILMTGIDGLKTLRAIKADSSNKHIPVVLLTALAQENVVLQGIKLGAADYLRKPFHPDELLQRLTKHLPVAAA